MSEAPSLADACVRVYRRYATEIVEALGFCPYAERCRLEGGTRELVLDAMALDEDLALAAVDALVDDGSVEIALVIWPRVRDDRASFSRFVQAVRAAHQRGPRGLVFAMEGFHPDADADLSTHERLVPFVRRTPDPTIQLVRLAVLDRVRRGTPQGTAFVDPASVDLAALLQAPTRAPLHERIAATNHATVEALGAAHVRAILDDILADRDRAYAAFGEPPRRPESA